MSIAMGPTSTTSNWLAHTVKQIALSSFVRQWLCLRKLLLFDMVKNSDVYLPWLLTSMTYLGGSNFAQYTTKLSISENTCAKLDCPSP